MSTMRGDFTRYLKLSAFLTMTANFDVRTKTFQAIDQFLLIARQHHEKMHGGDADTNVGMGMPTAGNASLLGWAMSSLAPLKGKVSERAPAPASNTTEQPVSSTSDVISDSIHVHASSELDSMDQPAPSSPTSTDGWGELENGTIGEDQGSDKEGWDDIEPSEEQKPPPLATIQAAQKRPVAQSEPQASTPKPKPTLTSAAPHEDDDLWGSVAAPPPKTTSKPLHSKSSVSSSSQSDDNLWGSIAAAPPKTAAKPLNLKPAKESDDSDPWAAIAAPAPATKARPLSSGRGRGARPAPPRLGTQRVDRTSSSDL